MKPFVFVQRDTPEHLINPIRRVLRRMATQALLDQTSNDWELVSVGLRSGRSGNVHFVRHGNQNLFEKDAAALEYIQGQGEPPKFVMSLDDDDLINRDIVRQVLEGDGDFDVLTDSAHAYFDVTSGQFKCVRLPGFPNSTIHRWEHAIRPLEDGIPLFAHNHYVTWRPYYESVGARIRLTEAHSPTYLRVLSPSSISALGGGKAGDITAEDMRLFGQHTQLSKGVWFDSGFEGFDTGLLKAVHDVWTTQYGHLARESAQVEQSTKSTFSAAMTH